MRILLASNAAYYPPRGGSTRSNLIWLRHLASAGHACRVVCAAAEPGSGAERELAEQKIESAHDAGVEIIPIVNLARQRGVLANVIAEFKPDWVLVSSEDITHSLLREAASALPGRLVYLAHTPQFAPFGPESWNPDPAASDVVREAAGIVVIGQHMAEYVRQHLGGSVEPVVIHPPIYGDPPYRVSSGRGYLLMVNPCKVKGIEIFVRLADEFRQLPFAAIPGWGTTAEDLAELAKRPNIQILPTVKDMEDALVQARLLLMPSIWYEGFGLIAMEALLRGVPVIASDSGGLVEAKRGTGYVLPVRPIGRYQPEYDDRHMPIPEQSRDDPAPMDEWIAAIRALEDPTEWNAESRRSLDAAMRFTSSLDVGQFEQFLLELAPVHTSPSRAKLLALLAARKQLSK